MTLKATCPTSKRHKRFETTAHVMEAWIVDEAGEFVRNAGTLEVTHKPRADNLWTCTACGAQATVVEA